MPYALTKKASRFLPLDGEGQVGVKWPLPPGEGNLGKARDPNLMPVRRSGASSLLAEQLFGLRLRFTQSGFNADVTL